MNERYVQIFNPDGPDEIHVIWMENGVMYSAPLADYLRGERK